MRRHHDQTGRNAGDIAGGKKNIVKVLRQPFDLIERFMRRSSQIIPSRILPARFGVLGNLFDFAPASPRETLAGDPEPRLKLPAERGLGFFAIVVPETATSFAKNRDPENPACQQVGRPKAEAQADAESAGEDASWTGRTAFRSRFACCRSCSWGIESNQAIFCVPGEVPMPVARHVSISVVAEYFRRDGVEDGS